MLREPRFISSAPGAVTGATFGLRFWSRGPYAIGGARGLLRFVL